MSNSIKIGLAISTYNRCELLGTIIDYIKNNKDEYSYISIVDNGSNDNTYEILNKELSSEKIIITKFEKNNGPSFGFSKAIEKILKECDYILLIDDDCVPSKDSIKKLLEVIKEKKCEAACGNLISISTGKPDPKHRGYVDRGIFSRSLMRPLEFQKIHNIDLSSFNGIIFSRNSYEAVNGIDTDYYYNYEDLDLSYKLSKNFGLIYVPEAIFTHYEYKKLIEDERVNGHLEKSARMIFTRRNQMWFARKIKKSSTIYAILFILIIIKDCIREVRVDKKCLKIRLKHRLLALYHGICRPNLSTFNIKAIYEEQINQ